MGGGHGEGTTYKGLTMYAPKRWHVITGKGMCAMMWFWVLYRAKQDGPFQLRIPLLPPTPTFCFAISIVVYDILFFLCFGLVVSSSAVSDRHLS
ncbi:hypothetical protein F8388_016727 [Cannabis sativa]|uniref:Uncharacterized protein n=1 Tax=Cannabis sativa TaxID=3483 RepID=A0A7J6GX97_CANSA|nr:hypothetical protein F8388_016727 [Cannabis sativa]